MSRIDSILSGSLVFRDNGTYLSEIRPGVNKVTITGSLQVSGSNLLLNGSDIGLRITTLEAGQGADQVKFGAITLWTASMGEWSASIDDYVDNLNEVSRSFNLYTGSTDSRINQLEVSSSNENISSSLLDSRITVIESKPLVSSSAQIDALGFLSASITGIVSRSAQISELGFITGSKFSELDDIPSGIISSSVQIDELFNLDGIISSSTQLESQISGAFAAPSSSFSTRISTNETDISNLQVDSGSFSTRITDVEATSSNQEGRLSTLEGKTLLSSSNQIASDISGSTTLLSSSIAARFDGLSTEYSDLTNIPSGIVSSSAQIDDLFDIDGLISSSEQIEDLLPFTFKQTGSYGSANTDVEVTGSFNISLDGISKYFSIDVNGEEKVKVNEEGVFQLISQSSAPTAVEGGIYFSNDYNLYLGVND